LNYNLILINTLQKMAVIRGSDAHLLSMLKNCVKGSIEILDNYSGEIPQRENITAFLDGFNGASDEYILHHKDIIFPRVMDISEKLHPFKYLELNKKHERYLLRNRIDCILYDISRLTLCHRMQNSIKYLNRIKLRTDYYIDNNIDKIEKNISKIENEITDFENDEMLTSSTNAALDANSAADVEMDNEELNSDLENAALFDALTISKK